MPALALAGAAADAPDAAELGIARLRPRLLSAAAVLLLVGSAVGFVWHGRTQRLDQAADLAERRVSRLADDLAQTLALAKVAIAQTEATLNARPTTAAPTGGLGALSARRAELLAALPLPFELHALAADGREIELATTPSAGTGHRSTYPAPSGPMGIWAVGLTQGPPGARELPLLRPAAPNAWGVAAYAIDLTHRALQERFESDRLPRGGSVVLHRIDPDGAATVLARAPLVETEIGQRVRGPFVQAVARAPQGVFSAPGHLDGVHRIVAYRRLDGDAAALVLAYGIATDEVLAGWRAMLPGIASITLLLAAGMAFGGWRLDRSLQAMANSRRALQRSELHFRALADNLPDVVVRMDRQGRHLYANAAIERATGLPPAAFLGKTNAELGMPAEHVARWMACLQQVFDSGQPGRLEFSFPGPAGDTPWESLVVLEQVADGGAPAALVISRDISERRRADEALRASEQRFRLAASSGQVWEWDLASGRFHFPDAFWQGLGMSPPDPTRALDVFDGLVLPDDRQRLRAALRAHLRERQPYQPDYRMHDAQGRVRWFHTQAQALWAADGRATYMAGTVFEITERRAAEDALRASESRLNYLLRSAPTVIYTAMAKGDFGATYYSPNLHDLLGWDPAQFIVDPGFWLAHVHPDDREALLLQMGELPRLGEAVLEYRFAHADGRWRWMRDAVRLLRDGSGEPAELVGSWIDITDRREAEADLRTSEQMLRHFFESDLVGMAITEPDKHWGQFNHRLCEILGYSSEQMQQQTWAQITHPDDLAADLAHFERLLSGEADGYRMDKRFIRGDGTLIDAAISVRCQRDAAGKPVRFYAIVEDIGARKQAEARLARQRDELESIVQRRTAELDRSVTQLRQANQELETFTYSVSHDLKAPLRGIDGYSRLLLSDHLDQLDDEGRGFLGHIRQATQHMGVLIDDLLAYSRLERRDLTLSALPLTALVDSALVGFQPDLAARGVRLDIDIPPDLQARGDAQGLTMSVRNLLDNALKFSATRQPPHITITGTRTEDGVLLAIQDNGLGFDMKFHDRIFAIFQRLHRAEDYPGTGVGLAIVRKAMERMGGRVWAVSQPGQGATFTLQLPEA